MRKNIIFVHVSTNALGLYERDIQKISYRDTEF